MKYHKELIFLLLALAIPNANADQKIAGSPIEHFTFEYDDSNWEARTDEKPASYAIRNNATGVVLAVAENKVSNKGAIAQKVLDEILARISLDFKITKSTEEYGIGTPKGWTCQSFTTMHPVEKTTAKTKECIFLGNGFRERLTIIIPGSIDEASLIEINKVIDSLKNV